MPLFLLVAIIAQRRFRCGASGDTRARPADSLPRTAGPAIVKACSDSGRPCAITANPISPSFEPYVEELNHSLLDLGSCGASGIMVQPLI